MWHSEGDRSYDITTSAWGTTGRRGEFGGSPAHGVKQIPIGKFLVSCECHILFSLLDFIRRVRTRLCFLLFAIERVFAGMMHGLWVPGLSVLCRFRVISVVLWRWRSFLVCYLARFPGVRLD